MFELFEQGSFRFLASSQSGADADGLVIVRVGRYGKAGFIGIGFYHGFGDGGLKNVVVAYRCVYSQQSYSRTETGTSCQYRCTRHTFRAGNQEGMTEIPLVGKLLAWFDE